MQTNRSRLAVLASGRGSNFAAVAANCVRDDFPARVACLITDNPKAGAIDVAQKHGIPCHVVDPGRRRGRLGEGVEEAIVGLCVEAEADLVFLAGFMRILRGPLLSRFAGRILNVHPSLLPSFKGLDAQRQALEYGVKVSGCTVHFVDDSVDGGPIVLQASVPVLDGDDFESVRDRILDAEHRLASEAISIVARGAYRIVGRRVLRD